MGDRATGRFPIAVEYIEPWSDPAKWSPRRRAAAWAALSDVTGETPAECRDLAAALGLIDQPQWVTNDVKGGAEARRRVK